MNEHSRDLVRDAAGIAGKSIQDFCVEAIISRVYDTLRERNRQREDDDA